MPKCYFELNLRHLPESLDAINRLIDNMQGEGTHRQFEIWYTDHRDNKTYPIRTEDDLATARDLLRAYCATLWLEHKEA